MACESQLSKIGRWSALLASSRPLESAGLCRPGGSVYSLSNKTEQLTVKIILLLEYCYCHYYYCYCYYCYSTVTPTTTTTNLLHCSLFTVHCSRFTVHCSDFERRGSVRLGLGRTSGSMHHAAWMHQARRYKLLSKLVS